MNKYIAAFVGGLFGLVLGALLLWFVVLDPSAAVYTLIDSLPESFRAAATNIFIFCGWVLFACLIAHFTRIGYLSATKEGNVKLKAENEKYKKSRSYRIENFLVKHGMRFALGLVIFALSIFIYEITNIFGKENRVVVTVLLFVYLYVVGYAANRLWSLTWGKRLNAKLDEWGKEREDA